MPIHFAMALMLGLPAPSAPPQGQEGPAIERLGPSATSIGGKSLPFDSHAPRLLISIPSEVDELELTNPYLDDSGINSTTMIGRLKGKQGVSAESFIKDVNAMRILAFMTLPGEKVAFSLKSEQSRVRLAVYPDPKAAKMKAAIKRANMPPSASRSKKLTFTNTSKEPYEMLLLVYGLHGYEYSLGWEREPKK